MNIIFLLNLLFIVSINLFDEKIALFCSLIYIVGIYFNKKNKSLFFILLGIVILLNINYNIKTIENISLNNSYTFKIKVHSDISKIIKVNGRYLKKNYYPVLDEFLEDGTYTILGEVSKIKGHIAEIRVLNKLENSTKIKNLLNRKTDNLLKSYPYEFQNFAKAVLLGQKDGISQNIKQKFNFTGTSHLLVVSGLHIGIIIFVMLFLMKNIPYQMRYILTGVILTVYCYGIGYTPSVMRAYIMGMVYLGAKIFYEEREMIKALMVAFMISSFINPYAIRSISYQMSYFALLGILFLYPEVKKQLKNILPTKMNNSKILNFLILSFSIQIILTPIFLYYFRVLPLFSFIPNLIVIPLGTILIQLLFISLLTSFVGLGSLIVPTGYYLYKLLIVIITVFYKIPFLTLIFYGKISLILYIYLYMILFLFILLKNKNIAFYLILGIIPILLFTNPQRTTELKLKWCSYTHNSYNILTLNKNIKREDLFILKDSGINRLNYIVTSSNKKNADLTKAYKNADIIFLNYNETIKIGQKQYINRKGKILDKK